MKYLNCLFFVLLCIFNSLVAPGGGLFYLKVRRVGAYYFLSFLSVLLVAVMFRVIYSVELAFLFAFICLIIYIFGVVHTVWKLAITKHFPPFNNLYFFLVFVRNVSFLLVLCLSLYFKSTVLGFDVYFIRSQSMLPNLYPGDIVLADTWFRRDKLKRNDVVFFSNQNRGDVTLVKRIKALPGDTVKYTVSTFDLLSDNNLNNGLDHLYAEFVTVERGEVFVVGDNLSFSKDSRHFGSLESGLIKAKGIWRLRRKAFFRL